MDTQITGHIFAEGNTYENVDHNRETEGNKDDKETDGKAEPG